MFFLVNIFFSELQIRRESLKKLKALSQLRLHNKVAYLKKRKKMLTCLLISYKKQQRQLHTSQHFLPKFFLVVNVDFERPLVRSIAKLLCQRCRNLKIIKANFLKHCSRTYQMLSIALMNSEYDSYKNTVLAISV